MNSKLRNVQNLDVEKLDGGGTGTVKGVRRVIKRRLRKLYFKGFGLTIRFRQQDERGSEET